MDIPVHYLEHIRASHPDLNLEAVTTNREGMVNDVVIVNDELVFRFPKTSSARKALADEAHVLEIVSACIDLPVPCIDHLSAHMASYRLIHGRPLTHGVLASLNHSDMERLFEQLGTFLHQLHSIDPRNLTGVPNSEANRTREDWISLYGRVEDTLFPLLMGYQRDWVSSHFTPLLTGELDLMYEPALIHADLAPYHLLFDNDTLRLAGVIDFGTAGMGDPAVDVACLLYHYGEPLVRHLSTTYPQLDTCLARARFHAGTLELQWALSGLLNNDRSLMVAHIGSARGFDLST